MVLLLLSPACVTGIIVVASVLFLWSKLSKSKSSGEEENNGSDGILPPEQIPGPYCLPIIGSLYKYLPLVGEYSFSRVVESHMKMYKTYGPIVHECLGDMHFVRLFDPQDVKKLICSEGRDPKRPVLDVIKKIAEDLGKPPVWMVLTGEDWRRNRAVAQQYLSNTKVISRYHGSQEQVALDFICHIGRTLNEDGELEDLVPEVTKYVMEGMATMVYSKRLGLFKPTETTIQKSDTAELNDGNAFLQHVRHFHASLLGVVQKWHFIQMGFFKKEYENVVHVYESILNKVERLTQEGMDSGAAEDKYSFLHQVMKIEGLSFNERANLLNTAILGGVETTGLTLSHLIYHLAHNQEKQEKLYQELKAEVTAEQPISPEVLEDGLMYLKATVKESQRMTPIAPTSTIRTLDQDLEIRGYRIPKGYNVAVENGAIGRIPLYFPNPEKFEPERWLKDDKVLQRIATYVCVPFGLGGRNCPGKKLALQEIYLLMAHLVLTYRIEYHQDDVPISGFMFQEFEKPVKMKFMRRDSAH